MDTRTSRPLRNRRAAFTLIEMIGVLAIIAILASIIAPNMVRSLERTAVRAEQENLRRLGDQVELYVSDTRTNPTSSGWVSEIGTYSDLSPSDIQTNRRNNNRVLLLDPASSPSERILLLSSMRDGLSVPTASNINTAARFEEIWNTADGSVPSTTSWSGWSAWAAVADSGDYLIIERVNLRALYLTDLRTYTVTLNNHLGTTTASYQVVLSDGSAQAVQNIDPVTSTAVDSLHSGDVIYLFRSSGGANLDYNHVISDAGASFDFDGTSWTPQ